MTKDMRVKAMGQVINACQRIKDDQALADEVREIVRKMHEAQAEFKAKAREGHETNVARKQFIASAAPAAGR